MLKIAGIYRADGTIHFGKGRMLNWNELSEDTPPDLPPSIRVELTISFKANDLLLGENGFVWATIELRQAEIIQSTLLAQHINSEIKSITLAENLLFTIKILNENDIKDAVDFIWQSRSGLRLKPDWVYPEGEKNHSFEEWLTGQ
ncbi:MAG TPA: hypothetical protein VKD08_09285 [Ignavibacteriaceae bacterium]|nr:hypothetical protein [Ignavibacteriaceae bacterium]